MVNERNGKRRFLTVAEVADEMRVSSMTVYRLVHAGQLRAVRVGRSYRVPEEALDEFFASDVSLADLEAKIA